MAAPLGVGVTGHRPQRLAGADPQAIAADARAALRAIADAAGPGASLRLISSLAEGADTIVMDEALALGWKVDIVLPFHREEYAADFVDEAVRKGFLDRLDRASAVLELPGHRGEAGGSAAAYERAGRVMLSQSDILVAVWDGDEARGRGGAAQIVAEALDDGMPVLHLDPAGSHAPRLLWDGLGRHVFGQHRLKSVPRGSLADLPQALATLADPSWDADDDKTARLSSPNRVRPKIGIAYPLLLALMGVRRPSRSDFLTQPPTVSIAPLLGDCAAGHASTSFGARLEHCLAPAYARADCSATHVAQLFRSAFVSNFALAALAVMVSLLGLALPAAAKPFLVTLEFVMLSTILFLTQVGNKADWHRRWLDSRRLAERLRFLAISAQLGHLGLRDSVRAGADWVGRNGRSVARSLGLPSAVIDDEYLECVRSDLVGLIDRQIAYLELDARRMHKLEHRLHLLGTILFSVSAAICAILLLVQAFEAMEGGHLLDHGFVLGVTIASAALPAIGAAIYGIRMQGDFAGIAERGEALARQFVDLRAFVLDEPAGFDSLSKQARVTAELLSEGVSRWYHAFHARPLALPG
jgi:hypothetical protein